jgi:hypothetical protein
MLLILFAWIIALIAKNSQELIGACWFPLHLHMQITFCHKFLVGCLGIGFRHCQRCRGNKGHACKFDLVWLASDTHTQAVCRIMLSARLAGRLPGVQRLITQSHRLLQSVTAKAQGIILAFETKGKRRAPMLGVSGNPQQHA